MVRVTLSNGEHDELVLGPFNQGVVTEPGINAYTAARLFDVASRQEIARLKGKTWYAVGSYGLTSGKQYAACFIQQVPISEQRMILGAELDVLVMETGGHCPTPGCTGHDHCQRIQQARARLEELT